MTNAGYVMIINAAVATIFLGVFAVAWLRDRRRKDAFWWFVMLFTALLMGPLEVSLLRYDTSHLPRLLLFMAQLASLMFFSAGVAAHYRERFLWPVYLALFVASVALNLTTLDMERNGLFRQVLHQGSYFLMGVTAIPPIIRRRQDWVDLVFLVAATALAFQFALRPVLAWVAGGEGSSPAAYMGTTYGIISQVMLAVTAIFAVTMMLALIGRDLVRDLRRRAMTDEATGLCNREGFMDELAREIAAADDLYEDIAVAVLELGPATGLPEAEIRARIAGLGAVIRTIAGLHAPAGRISESCFAIASRLRDVASLQQKIADIRMIVTGPGRWSPPPVLTAGLVRRRDHETAEEVMERAVETCDMAHLRARGDTLVREQESYVLPQRKQGVFG